jgi:hypothetical protein
MSSMLNRGSDWAGNEASGLPYRVGRLFCPRCASICFLGGFVMQPQGQDVWLGLTIWLVSRFRN